MRSRRQEQAPEPTGIEVALHRRVLVVLKTDKAIRGVLFDRRGDFLVVKAAELIEPGDTVRPVRLEGDVIIDRANIDFVQALDTLDTTAVQ